MGLHTALVADYCGFYFRYFFVNGRGFFHAFWRNWDDCRRHFHRSCAADRVEAP